MGFFNNNGIYWFSIVFFGFTLTPVSSMPVYAANSWTIGITPQLLTALYSGSTLRDTMLAYGLSAKANYLDKGGLTLGYNFTAVQGKGDNPDVDETSLYLSGRYIRYSDLLAGKLGLRLDGYDITDKTQTTQTVTLPGPGGRRSETVTFTDDVSVVYAQLDYTNYSERFYADVGFAQSDYSYQVNTPPFQDNTVRQLTAAAALALNNRYDWLQTRIYFIDLSHGNNTDGKTQSTALEFKWQHWFMPNAPLNVHSSYLKLLAGERLFPVDPEAAVVYSIADLQTGSIAAGLDWKVGEQSTFFLLVGHDQFKNLQIDDKYNSNYLFGSLSVNW